MSDHFRLSGHLQAPEVTPKPEPAPIQAAGLRTPEGYHRLERVEVWANPQTGALVVLAEPDDVWPSLPYEDGGHPHDCDGMGCLSGGHVVCRGRIEGGDRGH